MRSGLLGALVSLVCILAPWCLPGAAGAAETAKMTVGFSPYKLGHPTTIDVDMKIGNSNGGVPGPVTSFTTHLPPALELVGSTMGLAICKPASLFAGGLTGCNPNARLGSGSATVAVPFGPEVVTETASIDALMGPPIDEQIGILLYAEGLTPVLAQSVLPGVLLIGTETVGETISTTVPLTPTLPGAADASMISLHMSFGPNHLTYYKRVHGRKVAYRPTGVALPTKCPRGGFQFVTDLTFQDGVSLKAPSTIPCPVSHHHGHR